MLLFKFTWLLGIVLTAVYQDLKTRTIANSLIIIGFSGLVIVSVFLDSFYWQSSLIGFLTGFLLWHFKLIGGGDGKLIWLVSSAFPVTALVTLYTFIALSGAVQGVWALKQKLTSIPYALAIALGVIGTIITGVVASP